MAELVSWYFLRKKKQSTIKLKRGLYVRLSSYKELLKKIKIEKLWVQKVAPWSKMNTAMFGPLRQTKTYDMTELMKLMKLIQHSGT